MAKAHAEHPDSLLDDSFSQPPFSEASLPDQYVRRHPAPRSSSQTYLDFYHVQSPYRPAKRDDAKGSDAVQLDRFSVANRDLASHVLRDLRLSNSVETIYKLKGCLCRLIRHTLNSPPQLEKFCTFPFQSAVNVDFSISRLRVLSRSDFLSEFRWTTDRLDHHDVDHCPSSFLSPPYTHTLSLFFCHFAFLSHSFF
jgi:hypothetical protein